MNYRIGVLGEDGYYAVGKEHGPSEIEDVTRLAMQVHGIEKVKVFAEVPMEVAQVITVRLRGVERPTEQTPTEKWQCQACGEWNSYDANVCAHCVEKAEKAERDELLRLHTDCLHYEKSRDEEPCVFCVDRSNWQPKVETEPEKSEPITEPGVTEETARKNAGHPCTCPHCDAGFWTQRTLERHIRDTHQDQQSDEKTETPEAETPEHPFVCPECGDRFKAPKALGAHRRFKHGIPGANSHANKKKNAP